METNLRVYCRREGSKKPEQKSRLESAATLDFWMDGGGNAQRDLAIAVRIVDEQVFWATAICCGLDQFSKKTARKILDDRIRAAQEGKTPYRSRNVEGITFGEGNTFGSYSIGGRPRGIPTPVGTVINETVRLHRAKQNAEPIKKSDISG